jgi:dTDP-4-amino-4,6-dideoxygalactose transaminase
MPTSVDNEPIPFLDLVTPHRELEEELMDVVRRALRTAAFIGGPMVTEFEESFARVCGTRFCVGLGSGTDALRFAIISAGIGAGDVVITVPNTFIATTEAISQAGALPEFVDINERTYNMNPERLREYLENGCVMDESSGKRISRRSGRSIAGIIPVHLYGQMADMDPILELAEKYNLVVIEDACQAHGAEYFSRKHNCWFKAGSMGLAAAFSFYPGKNLGACGEAGAITTNDQAIATKVRMLRDHGQARKYYHDIEGYNGRLDALQAGILQAKLAHLMEWNTARRSAAIRYLDLLNNGVIVLPHEPEWSRAVYHLFVVRTSDRGEIIQSLQRAGIGTGIHYPIPLHLQRAYRHSNYALGAFPATEKLSRTIISLPMYPTLTASQQERVVEVVLSSLPEVDITVS